MCECKLYVICYFTIYRFYVILSTGILSISMLSHGFSPNSIILGIMIPIPKDKRKSLCNSVNNRAIALSSIISKILDLVILIKEGMTLCSSDLQFGFKMCTSTTQCTFSMLGTIGHYNFLKSNSFVLILDASKSFDRVNYCKLFRELLKREMSPLVLRLLLFMYTNQTLRVKWGSVMSESFTVMNGVKQGGVLSPVLFAVYTDGLLLRLQESGIGCHIGGHYAVL